MQAAGSQASVPGGSKGKDIWASHHSKRYICVLCFLFPVVEDKNLWGSDVLLLSSTWRLGEGSERDSPLIRRGVPYQSRNHSSVIVPNLLGTSVPASWHRLISSLHKASEQKRKLAHNNPSLKSKHHLTLGLYRIWFFSPENANIKLFFIYHILWKQICVDIFECYSCKEMEFFLFLFFFSPVVCNLCWGQGDWQKGLSGGEESGRESVFCSEPLS